MILQMRSERLSKARGEVMKKAAVVVVVLLLACSLVIAQEVQQKGKMPKGHPQTAHRQVIEPDFVKGKWSAVVLRIEDRKDKQTWEATVPIGKRVGLTGTPFEIEVQYFFPSFFMDSKRITSVSNQPKNPAAKIVVYEGDKKLHEGWIFALMPEVHAFKHKRFGIFLVRGVEVKEKKK